MGNKNKCFAKFDGGVGGNNINFNSQLVSNESAKIGFASFGIVETSKLFTSTWTTTISNETITLPYGNDGIYSGTIDWGDGSTSANSYANRTHTYVSSGTYTIVINGDCKGWSFGLSPIGQNYISSVVNWGQLELRSTFKTSNNYAYFQSCTNLNLSSVSDTLNLTGINTLSTMFGKCTSLTTINNINSWETSAITDMSFMFNNCTLFNQSLSFNTSAVTSMNNMFNGATAFNQNIGSWNVSLVTNFSSFMAGKTPATFSTTNLDAIYNGWSASGVKPNLTISFGGLTTGAKYSASGVSGRAVLIASTNNWTILDGGLI